MPRGDRTGPLGEGPKTGRQMGFCVGNEHPGFANLQSNWRRGYGSRFRGGYGNYSPGRLTDVSEKTMIENEIRILKDQLSSLEDRLSKIEEE